MSTRFTLAATIREKIGKNANRRLREQGIIPAVFYGPGKSSIPLQVNESALIKAYGQAGRTTLITLEIDDKGKKSVHPCLVWDTEYYPTKNRFQHVDFYGVNMDKDLQVRVPLEFTGVAKGTKVGGKLEIYREQILIRSKPNALPQKIVVNISDLDVGQSLRVADLPMPKNVYASYDLNFAILTVNIPGAAKADEEEAS